MCMAEKIKRVALVGKGAGWEFAPDHGEVWGINDLFIQHYVSKIFEMHDYDWTYEQCLKHQKRYVGHYYTEEQLERNARNKRTAWDRMIKVINKNKISVMSVKKYPYIPTSEAYPLDEVIKFFGIDYFTCCLAYMIAYAIYDGYNWIDLFGCSMESGSEWDYQRTCVSFWLGVAYGRKVTITNTGTEDRILRIPGNVLYGYERMQEFYGMIADTFRWVPEAFIKKKEQVKIGRENPFLDAIEEGEIEKDS